jgi:hypothetical protein
MVIMPRHTIQMTKICARELKKTGEEERKKKSV